MADILDQVKAYDARNSRGDDANWAVHFVGGEVRTGKITRLGSGNYMLEKGDRVFFFNVEKVLFVTPN